MQRRKFLQSTLILSAGIPLFTGLRSSRAQTSAGRFSRYDDQVRPMLARMTLREKIGQMTQAELGQLGDGSAVARLALGSILSGGGADPVEGNSLEAWTDTVESLIRRSQESRLGIPILYGVDAVHGHSNVLGAVIFPHNIGLGCTRNPDLIERIGRITAEEVRATGIHWTFAPCVTVPRDERWGRTYEGFGEDPQLSASLGAAAIRGLQGQDLNDPLSILACAKHYLGDGGATYGSRAFRGRTGIDQGDTRLDEDELRRVHLAPYLDAVAAGVGSVMVSYNSWNGAKVTGIRRLLTEILKEELGFEGFLISDYNAISQVDPDRDTAIMQSINAGIDMAMEPDHFEDFIDRLTVLVEAGRVPETRIDDAVLRILRIKAAMGLLDPERNQLPDRNLHQTFGAAAHREVARQAVRESLVLLKNAGRILPIDPAQVKIHVAGREADDIGMQCGGWTVEWQGKAGPVTTGGTTILTALKATVADPENVSYSADGSGAAGATVGIAVIGEIPYAEGVGDRADLAIDPADRLVVKRLKEAGLPVVVILLSGRPLILGDLLDEADALIAAWLPGTEGQGVADVLLGRHAPTGKLSCSWPRTMAQVPINAGDGEYDPLFAYGYGLGY